VDQELAPAPACELRKAETYDVPVDPMDLLGCDSCQ
jgi:hypothetical protein